MTQTIILFVAILLVIHSIYNTIVMFREVNNGVKLHHSFLINIITISLGLTYIIWYCN